MQQIIYFAEIFEIDNIYALLHRSRLGENKIKREARRGLLLRRVAVEVVEAAARLASHHPDGLLRELQWTKIFGESLMSERKSRVCGTQW